MASHCDISFTQDDVKHAIALDNHLYTEVLKEIIDIGSAMTEKINFELTTIRKRIEAHVQSLDARDAAAVDGQISIRTVMALLWIQAADDADVARVAFD